MTETAVMDAPDLPTPDVSAAARLVAASLARRLSADPVELGQYLTGVKVQCDAQWSAKYSVPVLGDYHDHGTARVQTSDASISSRMRFTSPDWATSGPTTYDLLQCEADVPLTVPSFTWPTSTVGGAVLSSDWVRQTIISMVQDDINAAICDSALGTALGDALVEALPTLMENLAPYLQPHNFSDPADADARVVAAAAAQRVDLLDWRDPVADLFDTDEVASRRLDQNVQGAAPPLIGAAMPSLERITACLSGSMAEAVDVVSTSVFSPPPPTPRGGFWQSSSPPPSMPPPPALPGFNGGSDRGEAQGINKLADALLTGGRFSHAGLSMPLFNASSAFADVALNLTGFAISGLNSFLIFDVFRPIATTTFSHRIAMRELDASANLTLRLSPPKADGEQVIEGGGTYEDHLTVSFGLRGIDLNASTLLAVDEGMIKQLQLGSLLATPLGCVAALLFDAEMSQLHLRLAAFKEPVLSGFLSDGISHIITTVVDALFAMYQQVALRALPALVDLEVRAAFNTALPALIEEVMQPATCVPPAAPPPGASDLYLDLRGTAWWASYIWMGIDFMTASDPITGLSRLACVLPSKVWLGRQMETSINAPFAHATFGVTKLTLTGLDSLYNVSLDAHGPQTLRLAAGIAPPWKPLELAFDASYMIDAASAPALISNTLSATLRMQRLEMGTEAQVLVDAFRASSMQLNSMLIVDCWLATLAPVGGARISALSAIIRGLHLNVSCHNCTSTSLRAMAEKSKDPAASEPLRAMLNDFLASVADVVTSEEAAQEVDALVAAADLKCQGLTASPPPPAADGVGDPTPSMGTSPLAAPPLSPTEIKTIVVFAISVMLVLCGFVSCVRCCTTQRRNRRDQVQALPSVQQMVALAEPSLFREKTVPCSVRWLVPLTLCINISFFLMGHVCMGASVDAVVELMGEGLQIPGIFGFSIVKSTTDMWNAGAIELAVIIAVFSGLWPYIKMFSMLVLWFAPPSLVSPATRGATFSRLDSLGKWSMIDIFITVLSLVAFRVSATSKKSDLLPIVNGTNATASGELAAVLLPDRLFTVDMYVTVQWGLYANLIAQVLSQFVSHAAIWAHHNALAASTAALAAAEEQKPPAQQTPCPSYASRRASRVSRVSADLGGLANAIAAAAVEASGFDMGDDVSAAAADAAEAANTELSRVCAYPLPNASISKFKALVVWLMGVGAAVLVVAGACIPSFLTSINGVAGVAFELITAEAERSKLYSVLGVVRLLVDQGLDGGAGGPGGVGSVWGMIFLAAIFVICALLVPVVQSILLAYIWAAPLTCCRLRTLLATNEVLSAWQYLEVYVVGIVVLLLQIGQVSRFMVGGACNQLQPTFDLLVRLDLLNADDNECFYLGASIENGCYLLIAASLLLGLCNRVVCNRARSCVCARQARASLASATSKQANECAVVTGRQSPPTRHSGQVSLTRPGSNGGLAMMEEAVPRSVRGRSRGPSVLARVVAHSVTSPHRVGAYFGSAEETQPALLEEEAPPNMRTVEITVSGHRISAEAEQMSTQI